MRVTLCFGGSILARDGPDVELFQKVGRVLRRLKQAHHELLVVVGGGRPSRVYIRAGRELGAPNKLCDVLGIEVTRLNARLLTIAIGKDALQDPPVSIEAAVKATFRGKIPVMGGTTPGQTTDAVAAALANSSRSELLVYFVDVGGVYTSDPKEDPGAERIPEMRSSELLELAGGAEVKPGMVGVIDPVAARIIYRSRIRTLVLGKEEIDRLPEILKGAEHSGTTILPSD
ncbi:MAG: UMP kinase [Hadesarchaea archaeon]|nr:UMP kinase [Hadesarchaea archaeon]